MDQRTLDAAGVRLETDGAVATVVLDRPDRRNAQTPATWRALAEIGRSIDESTRVVVVRGEGPSFSAGLDVRMLTPDGVPGETPFPELLRLDDDEFEARIAEFQEAFTWWRRPEMVSIAAVRGHAIGAGFQLALACDLRVAADDARFCMKEPALGLVPDLTGTKPLVDIVGYSRALEICATSRTIDAEEAAALGIATVVVPPDELDATVTDLADALTTPMHGAVTATKRLLQGAGDRTYDEQRVAERREQVVRMRELGRLLSGGRNKMPGQGVSPA